jgi:Ca2+-binding RTX toxin-like protein
MTSLPTLSIKHDWAPAKVTATGALFEVKVTILNMGPAVTGLQYKRVMDWDIPPTVFSEAVTHRGVVAALIPAGNLERAHDNGFASVDPLVADAPLNPATLNTDFEDNDTADHGSLFLFNFDELASGASKTFSIFYGATGSEVEADAFVAELGLEIVSYGQHDGDPIGGTPATYMFGFKGVGGVPLGDPCVGLVPDPLAGDIVGTPGPDALLGTPGDDVIFGLEGNDSIAGRGGNDLICAGPGDDAVHAGAGDDTVGGGDGNDAIYGQGGADKLNGNAGNDTIEGGTGDDTINGGDGDDKANGGSGDDTIEGGDGDDKANGGSGDDTINGGDGDDKANGGSGNDTIEGGKGKDTANGGAGSDTVNGDGGDDTLNVKDNVFGNDTVDGGADVDVCAADDPSEIVGGCP